MKLNSILWLEVSGAGVAVGIAPLAYLFIEWVVLLPTCNVLKFLFYGFYRELQAMKKDFDNVEM